LYADPVDLLGERGTDDEVHRIHRVEENPCGVGVPVSVEHAEPGVHLSLAGTQAVGQTVPQRRELRSGQHRPPTEVLRSAAHQEALRGRAVEVTRRGLVGVAVQQADRDQTVQEVRRPARVQAH
jgi:hypothetical protein